MENKYLYGFLAFQPSETFGGRQLDDIVTVWVDLVHLPTIIISDELRRHSATPTSSE